MYRENLQTLEFLNRTLRYDLLSVDLGWSGKNLRRLALSFLDFKNKKIYSIYKPWVSLTEFLLFTKENLKPKATILLDIPLKGRSHGFFRPVERAMQRAGLPCRPSKNALVKGKKLLLEIEALGFRAIEIYPYEFYKFYCLLPAEKIDFSRELSIDPFVFRKFFPPYKRDKKNGIKNAEKIIKQLLNFFNLKLSLPTPPFNPPLRNRGYREERWRKICWDIYDSIFGAIAGYLLLNRSPWAKFVRDKTGPEILVLSDTNLKNLLESYTE